jgi:putative copper resistance protein D
LRAVYLASVTLHVLAAMLWLGGIFFLGLVGAPVLRAVEPAAVRQQLFHVLGLRFRTVGWTAIAVLLATANAGAFWASATGRTFAWKLALVAAMLVVSGVHDFVLGPRAGRAAAGSSEARSLRRRAAWAARLNALLGVALVVAAVRLVRGG